MTNKAEIGHIQIAETLQESQAHLTGMIASAMDAIITIDADRRILIFNEAAEKMFGYSAEHVIGSKLDRLPPERFREWQHGHIHHFGETGVTSRRMGKLGSIFGLRSNGEEFLLEASISQIQVGTGHLFTVILRDVNERVEADEKLIENEQRLRVTIEQAAVGIAHTVLDGHWLLANQKFLEILGYSETDLLTLDYQQIAPRRIW